MYSHDTCTTRHLQRHDIAEKYRISASLTATRQELLASLSPVRCFLTMARMNRRDCRTRTPKLGNAKLDRVEALQKAIRKAKKEGRPLPAHAEKGLPAGGASTAAAPAAELSTSASDFLSQMRAAAAKEVSQLRETAAARSSSNKKLRAAVPGGSSS